MGLKAEIARLQARLAFVSRCYELAEAKAEYLARAWSIVHPVDAAWMKAHPQNDWGSEILYGYRRPLPNGVLFTGLASYEYSSMALDTLASRAIVE